MLRIIIEGDRGEGATTLAIAIAQALRAEQPDFLVEYHGHTAAATAAVRRIIDGPPIPPGALHTKRVNIIDNGAVARPPRPGLAEDLAALVRNFTARLDAALRAAAVEIAANHQARRERTLRTWEQWAEALGTRGRPPLADFPPFDHTHQAVAHAYASKLDADFIAGLTGPILDLPRPAAVVVEVPTVEVFGVPEPMKWTEPTPVAELPHTITVWGAGRPEVPDEALIAKYMNRTEADVEAARAAMTPAQRAELDQLRAELLTETPPGGSTDSEPAPHGRGVAQDSTTREEGRPVVIHMNDEAAAIVADAVEASRAAVPTVDVRRLDSGTFREWCEGFEPGTLELGKVIDQGDGRFTIPFTLHPETLDGPTAVANVVDLTAEEAEKLTAIAQEAEARYSPRTRFDENGRGY